MTPARPRASSSRGLPSRWRPANGPARDRSDIAGGRSDPGPHVRRVRPQADLMELCQAKGTPFSGTDDRIAMSRWPVVGPMRACGRPWCRDGCDCRPVTGNPVQARPASGAPWRLKDSRVLYVGTKLRGVGADSPPRVMRCRAWQTRKHKAERDPIRHTRFARLDLMQPN